MSKVKAVENKETRERILESAEAVFAEMGFGGSRIKDIAGRAGVTSAMVHYYFRTKEDLHLAILDYMIADLGNMVARIDADPIQPIPKLRLFFYSLFDYFDRHRNFARMTAYKSGHESDEYFLKQVSIHLKPLITDAVIFLNMGMDAGIFRKVDPYQLLTVIYGMIISYFADSPFLDALIGEENIGGDFVAGHREILMDIILRLLIKGENGNE